MTYLISEICEFINGGAWSDKEYSTTGIPVLKVSNLQSGGIDFSKIDFIPEQSRSKYSKHLLKKDDLVIATVGSHPSLVNSAAGRATIISANGDGYLLNQNAVCLRTKDSGILCQKYLAYIGKTESFQHFIQQRGRGAANQMRIAIGAIKEYKLDLPSIDQQRRIASVLSAYDDLIENNLKRIKLLEELAQRTYEEWFVKFRVNGVALEMDDKTGLPLGWEKNKFNQIVDVVSGFPFKSGDYIKSGNFKIVTIKNVQDGYFVPVTTDAISTIPPKVKSKQRLLTGDIILSLTGNVGRSCLVFGNDYLLNQRVAKIVPIKKEDKVFVYHLLRNPHTIIGLENLSNGAAQQNLSPIIMGNMDVTIANEEFRQRFNFLFNPTLDQICSLYMQNAKLKEARDILLPRLMNGITNAELTKTKPATKIMQLEAPSQKQATPQFKEAILISLLTSRFGSEIYPLGRMRYTKLSYLFHRHADNQIKDYLRKAAGPYNPKTKYGGPEKIAHDNGYVVDHKYGQLKGFMAGPNIEKAKPYFESYWDTEYLNWLEAQFKYKSNDDLELFATVDNSLIELNKKNEPFTVEAVKDILKKEREWTAKLEREIFSDNNILRAITYLPTIFHY